MHDKHENRCMNVVVRPYQRTATMYILIGMDVDGPYRHIHTQTHTLKQQFFFPAARCENINVFGDEKLQLNDLLHTFTEVTHTNAHAEIVTFV